MKIHKLLMACAAMVSMQAYAAGDTLDSEGYPIMYVRGDMTNGWSAQNQFKLTRDGDTYSISLSSLNGLFKVSGDKWQYNYGAAQANQGDRYVISDADTFAAAPDGINLKADNLTDVTIKYKIDFDPSTGAIGNTYLQISANGHEAPDVPTMAAHSGTLPLLYINVYTDETKTTFDNEIISKDLDHKNYFSNSEYWLDVNGCQWLIDLGAESIGSAEKPLPLEIKARGNWTRRGFSKKPFKLKLGKKQSMLGMSKSKHYAILAHADDNYGYMRNFVGFNLGKRIGLPWTPAQQPIEVYINGDYRGIYFLTESIRIEEDRVNITELADNVTDNNLISGGYLIELDNYDEENQISMSEKYNPAIFDNGQNHFIDMLRVTFDTPEIYSDLQKQFVTDQFSTMNKFVGENNDDLWSYLDLDDAARYYLVEEIISHTESFHGSTYMFRDYGEGQKWHFSPLWDCGNGFNGATDNFFYNCDPFGNTWIPSMRLNDKFNAKVKETWLWFMSTQFSGIEDDIKAYASQLVEAAKCDHTRWHAEPTPAGGQAVIDNRDMLNKANKVIEKLTSKINWLKGQFGDFVAHPSGTEPSRDTTPAALLPDYAKPAGVEGVTIDTDANAPVEYFNLQGVRVASPKQGQLYIVRQAGKATKVIF